MGVRASLRRRWWAGPLVAALLLGGCERVAAVLERQVEGEEPAQAPAPASPAPAIPRWPKELWDTAPGSLNWQRSEPSAAMTVWAGDQGMAFAVEAASAMNGRVTLSLWDRGYPERLVLGLGQPTATREHLLAKQLVDERGAAQLLDPAHRFATRSWRIETGDAIRIDVGLRERSGALERRIVFASETDTTDEIEIVTGAARPDRARPAMTGWGRGVQRLAPGAPAVVYCGVWGDISGIGAGCLDYGASVEKDKRSLLPSWTAPAWSIYLEVEPS